MGEATTITIPHRWRSEPVWTGEAANLRDAVERAVREDANLEGAYLTGANLTGANLEGANLAGANLEGANLAGANLTGANLTGAYLTGANLEGANLAGANLAGAYLAGANLAGAYLTGANLAGANLAGAYLTGDVIVSRMAAYSGLYRYTVHAVVASDGVPWVRMGCLWHSVAEWDRIGIRASNPREYPDDDSPRCRERVRAFEFARASALAMAEEWKAERLSRATGGEG